MSDEEFDRKSFYLFGTDIGAIPCFRSSFLYGAGVGALGGLATFLFTSKARISCHIGYATFVSTTLVYWVRCRYKYAENKFSINQIQEAYKAHTLKEGTNTEVGEL